MRMTIMIAGATLWIVPIGCGQPKEARSPASADTMGSSATVDIATSSATNAGVSDSVVIHTTGNEMALGLARDTVYMGLSDSLLAKARADMAHDDPDTSGPGAALGSFIKKRVGSALGTRVRYPISDIQSVRYENGEIKFEYRHKHPISFESVSEDHKKALADFSPADARRFVAAVNVALRADDNQ